MIKTERFAFLRAGVYCGVLAMERGLEAAEQQDELEKLGVGTLKLVALTRMEQAVKLADTNTVLSG